MIAARCTSPDHIFALSYTDTSLLFSLSLYLYVRVAGHRHSDFFAPPPSRFICIGLVFPNVPVDVERFEFEYQIG
jgi:hypothetical protein